MANYFIFQIKSPTIYKNVKYSTPKLKKKKNEDLLKTGMWGSEAFILTKYAIKWFVVQ